MYVVDYSADEPIMLINKHIGNDDEDGPGIIGDLFQRELLELDGMGKKRIQVWINSTGGSVIDGYAIYNAILKSKTKVDTYCVGIAASIAGVIFQAGRKRIMADYGILMYHNPFGGDNSKAIDSMKDSICTMVSERSGMNAADVQRMMNRETFISADEALQIKFCDEVEASVELNKKRLVNVVDNTPGYWKEANKIVNSILKKSNMSFLKVTNKLALNDDAKEESIVEAIVAIENRATAAEVLNKKSKEDMDKMKADVDEAEDKLNKMKADYDACKNELTTAQNKIKVQEDTAKSEKAKALVTHYIKAGAIKNEAKVVTDWEAKAVADLEGTKNLLESIPLNLKATKFVIKNTAEVEKDHFSAHSAAAEMIAIENKLSKK